jgi:hypothetical protein
MVITCARDPKSSMEFKIRIQIRNFQVLYAMDRFAQSAIF